MNKQRATPELFLCVAFSRLKRLVYVGGGLSACHFVFFFSLQLFSHAESLDKPRLIYFDISVITECVNIYIPHFQIFATWKHANLHRLICIKQPDLRYLHVLHAFLTRTDMKLRSMQSHHETLIASHRPVNDTRNPNSMNLRSKQKGSVSTGCGF